MEQIKEITYFFNFSVPQKNSLSYKIKVCAPNAHHVKLADLCQRRYLEADGMSIFEELLVPIYHSLQEKKKKRESRFNNTTSTKADSLFKFATDLSLITTLVISKHL